MSPNWPSAIVSRRGWSVRRAAPYPTAREAALKLMETSYLSAQAFSGADLLHGPLAMIDPQVPVLTVAADGIGGRAMQQVFPPGRARCGCLLRRDAPSGRQR